MPRPALSPLPAPALALTLALALAACDESGAHEAGGVSPGEAKALEDAASMLDERRLPPEALPSPAPAGTASGSPSEMTGDAAPAAR